MKESTAQQEEIIFRRAELIQAVQEGNTSQARDILNSAYLLFMNKIDAQALRGEAPNLTEFSTELDKIFNKDLKNNKAAQKHLCKALKKTVSIESAHREGAIRVFRGILDRVQNIKDIAVTENTTLKDLGIEPAKMQEIIPTHQYDENTTLKELYKHRQDMLYNQRGALGKVMTTIVGKFKSNTPTPEDYKEFARQMVNLSILSEVQNSVQQQVKDQQANAQKKVLPEGYKQHLEEELSQSAPAKMAKQAVKFIARKAGVQDTLNPKQRLKQQLDKEVASTSMGWDMQLRPFTEKHLDSVDYMQQRAKAAQGSRNYRETASDLIRCIWEAIKDFFENLFGKESTKIINDVRGQHRDEMRQIVGRNAVKNLESGITMADKAAQKVQLGIESGLDKASSMSV